MQYSGSAGQNGASAAASRDGRPRTRARRSTVFRNRPLHNRGAPHLRSWRVAWEWPLCCNSPTGEIPKLDRQRTRNNVHSRACAHSVARVIIQPFGALQWRHSLSAVSRSPLLDFAVLPAVLVIFFGLRILAQIHPEIEAWAPKWDRLLLFAVVILLERVYRYRYAVSQRYVLTRDVISNIVNLYVNGFVTALLVLPALLYLPQHFLGRKLVFASPGELGPIWLQVVTIAAFVGFFRYWMHRLQHENQFLWELHSYHHRVTDLKAFNTYVSHPIDYALRNILGCET